MKVSKETSEVFIQRKEDSRKKTGKRKQQKNAKQQKHKESDQPWNRKKDMATPTEKEM